MKIIWYCVVLSYLGASSCQKDYFTSIQSLKTLYHTEEELLRNLKEFSISLQTQLEKFRKHIKIIKEDHSRAAENLSLFIGNPINSFSLIKRLVEDWKSTYNQVENSKIFSDITSKIGNIIASEEYPTEEDLIGSAEGFSRLQVAYNLDVAEIASGIINGMKVADSMSWSDCFYIGQKLYEIGDYNNTQSWIREALGKFTSKYIQDEDSVEILESIADITVAINDLDTALETSEKILNIQPSHTTAQITKDTIESLFSTSTKRLKEGSYKRNLFISINDYTKYEAVCREEITRNAAETRDLHCKFESYKVPFLKLAPFKVEVINFEPKILLFHDVLYDSETKLLKEKSLPTIRRSTHANVASTGRTSILRTSQGGFVSYKDDLKSFAQRLEDMTQLSLGESDMMQVANYGIGGHYAPHYDFFNDVKDYPNSYLGDRISTSMFYASDIQLGGSTAFPLLNINVKPVKGSMLFWYNLHASGKPDQRTLHAGCPVIKGSKWIFSIWLRLNPQFHHRKCGLEEGR